MLNLVCILLVCILSSKCAKARPLRYQFDIVEERAPEYIGQIQSSTNARIIFANDTLRSLLKIDKLNGFIYTTKKIDRDELQIDAIHFVLLATQTHPVVEVDIRLVDINDNSPTFPTLVQSLTISEATKVGSRFRLTSAIDIDIYMNAYIKYELVNSITSFSINIQDGSGDVYLIVDEALDREKVSNYILNLTAYDSGKPLRSGSCLLNITIADVNDNRPTFSRKKLLLFTSENTTVGTRIHTFNATDPDELSNSEIQYSIHQPSPSLPFTIDQEGSLILTHLLDYENITTLDFVVIATDKGLVPLDAQLEVSLNVMDVNDNPPIINVRSGNDQSIVEGVFLQAVITLHDADSENVNGNLSLHLLNHHEIFFITLVEKSTFKASTRLSVDKDVHEARIYVLKSRQILDREMKDSYRIQLSGTDSFWNTSAEILVRVTDTNDNAPVFENVRTSVTKPILTPIGTFIAFIKAIDLDYKENGFVQYLLENTSCSSLFTLSRLTGVLETKSFLHHCRVDIVKLIIVASDSGTPPQRSFLNMTVTLTGREKRCKPVFRKYREKIEINNDVDIHAGLANYKAVCEDGSPARYFYYFECVWKNYLQIDTHSGELYLRRRVDFNSTFFGNVVAVNEDNLSLLSVITVNFTFITFKELPKIFSSDVLILRVNSKIDSRPIATLVDMESRQVLGKEIKFIITTTTYDDGTFMLNETTSELFMRRPSLKRNCTMLTVSAIRQQESNSSIDIFVSTFIRQNQETSFERMHYSFRIFENTPKDSIFGCVKLMNYLDTQKKTLNHCRVYIESGNEDGLFFVRHTGILVLKETARQSHVRVHTLKVIAMCDCMLTSTKVDINIVDINNHIPVLISPNFLELSAATKIMTVIYQAESEDMDVGGNRTTTYALAEDCHHQFSMNTETGQITLLKTLSRIYYKINIIVNDDGHPRLNFITNILVRVKHSQDIYPRFNVPEPIVFLRANITPYEPIYTVHIHPDDCQYEGVRFNTTSSQFGIYPSGEIYLKRRSSGSYYVEVPITARCKDHQLATVSQTVHVMMETQELPVLFAKRSFLVNITENVAINTTVLNLSMNKTLQHNVTLRLNSQYFNLHGSELKVAVNIDREEVRQRYGADKIILLVYGNHTEYGRDSCFVVVHIEDENDNPPVYEWKEKIYNLNVGRTNVEYYVTSNDKDVYPYDVRSYMFLSGNQDNVFHLNNTTGQLSVTKQAYSKLQYLLRILTYDPEKTEFNDTLSVTVHLSTSSLQPKFNQSEISIDVNETICWGVIMDVRAFVVPAKYSLLRFSIANGNRNETFVLHPNTGMLYLTRSLDDVSVQSRYELDVAVVNELAPDNADNMNLVINVANANTHSPTFTDLRLTIYVHEDVAVGKVIGRCLATDLDDDDVVYSLMIQSKFRKFVSVDKKSCDIIVTSRLESVTQDQISFVIQASDGVHLSYLNAVLFPLPVSPPLVISPAAVVIRPGVQPSDAQEIYKLTVEKRLNETVTFRITGGIDSSLFRLSEAGKLYLTKEWRNSIWFTFLSIVVDSSNGKYSHMALLLFKENTDQIHFRTTYITSVRENTKKGEYVSEVKAFRRSQTNPANIKYYITSVSDQSYFRLDRTSGKLYVNRNIDREVVGGKIVVGVHAIDLSSRSISQTASTTVEIYIVDENDNSPYFTNRTHVFTIAEDSISPKVLTTVLAVDEDDGQNGIVSYDILSGNMNGTFVIDRKTGSVLLKKPLDYEAQSRYTLNVSACDHGIPSKCSYMAIIILVRDVNDNRPSYQHSTYFFSVSENEPIETQIAKITATDKDVGVNGQIYFEMESGDYGHFRIDATTGGIILQKTLKFDVSRLFMLKVTAYDGGKPTLSSLTDVYINILKKKNDFVPTPHKSYYTVSISENATIHSSVTRLVSRPGLNYQIVSGNDKHIFSLTTNGYLTVQRKVDREEKERHRLYITVVQEEYDILMEGPVKSYVVVDITVADINDNYPYFRSPPSFHVIENLRNNSMIGQLKAIDEDEGRNGRLVFALHDISSVMFDIDGNGTVSLRNQLDYETQKLHQFQVRVCDQGDIELCIVQTVNVYVDDENDNAPIFNQLSRKLTLFNNISADKIIMTLNASDADSGRNSQLSFKLINHEDVFEVNSSSGHLSRKNSTKLIVNKTYHLKVRVNDHGIPQQKTYADISLYIDEVNTPPRFRFPIQTIDLRENTSPSQHIAVIEATDNNTGANGKLTYSLSTSNNESIDFFSINSSTGVLELLLPADREIISSFNLTILVWDDGTPSLNDLAFIIVNIVDENDNTPTLISPLEVTVDEDFPIGEVFYQVRAIDKDAGENGRIKYTLLSHSSFLLLHPTNGELKSLVPFDHEYKTSYTLSISIQDFGIPSLAVTKNITLTILDVNDSPPRFIERRYSAQLEDGLQIGSFVLKLTGTDDDSLAKNSKMRFAIEGTSRVVIDQTTGVVLTNDVLPNGTDFQFRAIIFDPTKPLFRDTTNVSVSVAATGLFPQINHQKQLFFYIHENDETFKYLPITKINGSSPLDGPPSTLSYTIEEGMNDFFIQNDNGRVYLRHSLDYELVNRHVVWIKVEDSQLPPLSSYVLLIVYVVNSNDNPPRFYQNQSVFKVLENMPINSTIGSLTYYDLDGENSAGLFHLNDSKQVSIDPTTGVLYTTDILDYERCKEVYFNVMVFDPVKTDYKDKIWITLYVENTNDNPPMVKQFHNVSLPENQSIRTDLLEIQAFDYDGLDNITYQINSTVFAIDESQGVVWLNKTLDRESVDFFVLNVTVTDGRFFNSTIIYVHVLDVNDSPPQFKNNYMNFKVMENEKANTILRNISISDLDDGENSKYSVSFSTNESAALDHINITSTGKIILLRNAKITGQPIIFSFFVTAENIAEPYFMTSATVTIQFVDINNHPPVFNQSEYSLYIFESTKVGEPLISVYAVDKYDVGKNAFVLYNLTGHMSHLFSIDSMNGTVSVSLPIQRYVKKWLSLVVSAFDQGNPSLMASCVLNIFVEEDNTNPPQILYAPYEEVIPEDIPINYAVLQISAYDSQSKSDLTYEILSGNEGNSFSISPNGSIVTRKNIDYETVQFFVLNVAVTDRNFVKSKSSYVNVNITVADINDNPPVWNKPTYYAEIPESETNFSLKVAARDADSVLYNQLSYVIEEENSKFSINRVTGEISFENSFDYERQSMYTFSVVVKDNGNLSAKVNVTISVQGVNEFSPEFISREYNFSVFRNSQVGTVVGIVQAIDKDLGPGGTCVYISTMPNNYGIGLNAKTGEIVVSGTLMEMSLDFKVIVTNEDRALQDLRNTDQAHVHVDILAGPECFAFKKCVYLATVFENVHVGTNVINVSTTIKNESATVIFSLQDSDANRMFAIDPQSGVVSVAAILDRELVDRYNITVIAKSDDGKSTSAILLVDVLDVNDCRPIIKQCQGSILENAEVGSTVLTLEIVDDDLQPNTWPFTLMTNHPAFGVSQSIGTVVTKIRFDFEKQKRYIFNLTVTDNGVPKLSSTTECVVVVTDVNDNEGRPRHSHVIVNYDNASPTSLFVGDMSPIDDDEADNYTCSGLRTDNFYFQPGSCRLFVKKTALNQQNTSLRYNGTFNGTIINCRADVSHFNIELFPNSQKLLITAKDVSAHHFIRISYVAFLRYVNLIGRNQSSCYQNEARIISVQFQGNKLTIILLLPHASQIRKTQLINALIINLNTVMEIFKSSEVVVDYDPCKGYCNLQSKCNYQIHSKGSEILNTEHVVFSSLKHKVLKSCSCSIGWVGKQCKDIPRNCKQNPCYNQGRCEETPNGLVCICNKGFHGKYCQIVISPCDSQPCLNNGQCTNNDPKYQCNCQFGDFGKQCQMRSFNFQPGSSMKKTMTMTLTRLNISFKFASVEQAGSLIVIYNNDSLLTVEVLDSKLKCQMRIAGNYILASSDVSVSDGKFHDFQLTVNENMLTMVVDGSQVSVNYAPPCVTSSVHVINIGAVESFRVFRKYSSSLSAVEFIGCMGNIWIDSLLINPSNTLRTEGVTVGCKRAEISKICSCGNGGKCLDLWSNFQCLCPGGYISKKCTKEFQAVTLSGSNLVALSFTESYRRKKLLGKIVRQRRDVLKQDSFISVQFRTRNKSGVLFRSTNEFGSTKLFLQYDSIHYYFESGSETGFSRIPQANPNDGLWHNVSMQVIENSVSLVFDGFRSTKHFFRRPAHQFINSNITTFYFGEGFKGCLGKIRMNEDLVYLASPTTLFATKSFGEQHVKTGCISSDICGGEPCRALNESHCIDKWESFECVAPGACLSIPCQNDGQCIPKESGRFSCDCHRTSFTGQFCELHELCVGVTCARSKLCQVYGNQTACVAVNAAVAFDKKYIIIIIILAVILLLAVFLTFCATKRKWNSRKIEKVKENYFGSGIYNAGQDLDERTPSEQDVNVKTTDLNTSSLSLPAEFTTANSYHSKNASLHRFRSVDEIAGFQRGLSTENLLRYSYESMVSSHKADHVCLKQLSFPIESGFESTGSDIINQNAEIERSSVEAYNLDDASVGYSEMSFQYDVRPSMPFTNLQHQNQPGSKPCCRNYISSLQTLDDESVRLDDEMCVPRDRLFQQIPDFQQIDQGSNFTESYLSDSSTFSSSDSDVSFTCSECEYGTMSQNKGRRNPGYVFSKLDLVNLRRDQISSSDSSECFSSMTSFSNCDSVSSSQCSKKHRRKRRMRERRSPPKRNRSYNDTAVLKSQSLVNVPEVIVEEYV